MAGRPISEYCLDRTPRVFDDRLTEVIDGESIVHQMTKSQTTTSEVNDE